MLTYLKIRNFQIHESFDIELDSYITTIVGPSTSGKSSIIRALRWLALNKPGGSSFITWNLDNTGVQLQVDNHRISRIKGTNNNLYKIDGKELYSFGANVPEEISNILNITEENFQCQFDDPFWFLHTGGELSKELNKIINLELIDRCLGNIASELRETRSTISVVENQLQGAKQKQEETAWVVEADRGLEKIEKIQEGLQNNRREYKEVNRIVAEIQSLTDEIGEMQGLIRSGEILIAIGDKVVVKDKEHGALQDMVTRLSSLNADRVLIEDELERLMNELKEKLGGTCPVCGGEYNGLPRI